MNKLYAHNKPKKLVWSNSLPIEKKVIPLIANDRDTVPMVQERIEDPDILRAWEVIRGADREE